MKYGIRIIDKLRGTAILAKYYELRQLMFNDNLLADMRDQNLVNLLTTLKKHNAYYKPLLGNFSPEEIKAKPWLVLSNLTFINKKGINDHYHEIFSPIPGKPFQRKKTGGSTGEPFYYYVDKEHLSWIWAHNYLFWNLYSGYNPGDPFVTIAGNSLRTVKRQFSENIYHFLQNNYFIKGDVINKELKINYARVGKAVLIYGYPSSIQSILKINPDFPSYFNNLKAIFTTSEQLLPNVRKSIEEAFGKPVFDIYGANDGGIVSCECAYHNGYHYNSLNCYAETLENEIGMSEILLTNLSSLSFPFLRYRVGDLGKVDNRPCECGLTWPRIIDLKGRTRDLIITPKGKALHGAFFNNIFFRFSKIDGYRIVQEKDYSLKVFIHVSEKSDFILISTKIAATLKMEIPDLRIEISEMPDYNPTNSKFKLIESHVI